MKGFVPTPPDLVDAMVRKLFRTRRPTATDTLLDPGCGTGAFIDGVLRWCCEADAPVPRITGIDSDPALLDAARSRLGGNPSVALLNEDFLTTSFEPFDFVVGNPPYVSISGLSVAERVAYRRRFRTAVGRFDLYLLFFERALEVLKPEGRLVFVTPEKFLYIQSAAPLRSALIRVAVEEIELVAESAFGSLVTYPTITSLAGTATGEETSILLRDGTTRSVPLTGSGSWLPFLNGHNHPTPPYRLADAFSRISCGVATGADSVFVLRDRVLPDNLRPFAFRTIAGRDLVPEESVETKASMLIPYDRDGTIVPEAALGALGEYLRHPERHGRLMQRTCVARKPWYAFHENPPMSEILQPKILCKDIGARPWFIVDEAGDIVPRHSVYYLVPNDPAQINELCTYLNSTFAIAWLMANCQRAANGFIRLQSHVLKQLPIPEHLVASPQLMLA